MDKDSRNRLSKTKYCQVFVYTIYCIVRDLCHFKFHDVYISLVLRYRITTLKLCLRRLDINCRLRGQYRSKKTAHRWSTAYQIANGNITLGDLRRLKNGKDKDGNIWYFKKWDLGAPASECAKISKLILTNAIKMGQSKMNYAEEGYLPNDSRRLPNLKSIPVSKHVYGKAIDFTIDWNQLGGAWNSKAEQVVSRFGLIRPIKQEDWHFELNKKK